MDHDGCAVCWLRGRAGQVRPTRVVRLVAADTVEQKVLALQRFKLESQVRHRGHSHVPHGGAQQPGEGGGGAGAGGGGGGGGAAAGGAQGEQAEGGAGAAGGAATAEAGGTQVLEADEAAVLASAELDTSTLLRFFADL